LGIGTGGQEKNLGGDWKIEIQEGDNEVRVELGGWGQEEGKKL
jgi:hypothetical protein